MKNLKTIPLIIAAIALVGFTSCVEEKKENNVLEENDNQTEILRNDVDEVNRVSEMEAKRMANMKVDENILTEYKTTGMLKGWTALNDLNKEMKSLAGKDYATSKKIAGNLEATINDLTISRPDWLKTEDISEDIADLEKDYKKLMSQDNTNEDKFRRDLEEVNEQYDDLIEEVNETVEKYMKIRRDVTEDYIEEIKEGDPQEAKKELDKGMKKMEKVADDK